MPETVTKQGCPLDHISSRDDPAEPHLGSFGNTSTDAPLSDHGDQVGLQVLISSRNELVRVSRYCPGRPYISIRVPEGLEEIHRISFTTVSHDQGFCGEPYNVGTYAGSYTWFEAGVSTLAGRNDIPRKELQHNITANSDFKTHTTNWDICTAAESIREWMGRIRSGDSIELIPRAQWKAWVNHVGSAQIEIHCRMTPSSSVETNLSQLTITPAHNSTDGLDEVRNNYRYHQKLDNDGKTIRLLELHPGALNDPIHCDLIISSIEGSETPAFEALSYCWGDPTDTRAISLSHLRTRGFPSTPNDSDPHHVFRITSGLDEALRHLRHSDDRKRIIWVDAVCIDQSDLQERGFQVDMMGQIYAHASFVCIWLGNSNETFQQAMTMVQNASDSSEEAWVAQNGGETRIAYPRMLSNLSRFFASPWFRRVWVVQEVWKARKAIVSCGSDLVPWDMVITANLWMLRAHGGGFAGQNVHTLPSIWMKLTSGKRAESNAVEIQGRNSDLELLDILLEGIELNATDPRDKIYALLGISKETQDANAIPQALRSDYTKSTSDTFADFTRWWITKHKSLNILSAIHASSGRTWQELSCKADSNSQQKSTRLNHPSWALWHDGDGKWAQRTLGMSGLYKAAGDTLASLDASTTVGSRLSLVGVAIGTILSIHPYPYYQAKDPELDSAYIRLFDPAGGDGTWNFGATLDNRPPITENIHTMMLDHYIAHWSQLPDTKLDDVFWEVGEMDSWAKSAFPCSGKCFFRNSPGNFGLCPPGTRPGDIVVVLFGGSVPFILRDRDGHAEHADEPILYELIGECYVQGSMNGAAIEELQQGKKAVQNFVLV